MTGKDRSRAFLLWPGFLTTTPAGFVTRSRLPSTAVCRWNAFLVLLGH